MRSLLLVALLGPALIPQDRPNNNLLKEHSDRKQMQYLSAEEEARIRQMIPVIDHPDHNDRMRQATIYDSKTRWNVHQNDIAGTRATVLGSQYNISVSGPIRTDTGDMKADRFGNGNREYPWKFTAGVFDSVPSTQTKMLYLPPGQYVTYERKNGGYVYYSYPVGTSIYELLTNTSKTPFVYAVRVRTKVGETGDVAKDWSPDEFIPFVTRKEYQEATGSGEGKVREYTIRTSHDKAIGDVRGNLEDIPDLDEDKVLTAIKRPFKSRIGQAWAPGVDGVMTTSPGQLVPPNYAGMLFEVTKTSCARCHRDTMKDVDEFESPRDWYGKLRGSADGIFSWHPFDDSILRGDGFPQPMGFGFAWDKASLELIRRK